MVAPISAKTKRQQTSNEGVRDLRIGRQGAIEGDLEHFYSTASRHQQIHFLQTALTQRYQHSPTWHSPHRGQVLWGHLTVQSAEHRAGTAYRPLLQTFKVLTFHLILLGVGGTIYNNHTLEPFKELGLDSQRLKNLLPSFMFILSITLPILSIPDVSFPALLSTLIRRRFQVKPATLRSPLIIFLFYWWRSFTVPGTKVAPFNNNNN